LKIAVFDLTQVAFDQTFVVYSKQSWQSVATISPIDFSSF